MNLKIHTYTNKGGKSNNEDYLDYFYDDGKGCFILADGLGGHGHGEVASKLIVEAFLSEYKLDCSVDTESMHHAYEKANSLLLENQRSMNYLNMKTTAVLLRISEDKAIWGHIGDTRLYYISNNELCTVTKDHSVTYKKYLAGEILYSQINQDEDRSSLLNVLGKDTCAPEIIPIPQDIKSGDAFLLCTDGFWEYLNDDEILIDFVKSETPKQWSENMLLRHVKRTKPTNDNFSLIAIMVE